MSAVWTRAPRRPAVAPPLQRRSAVAAVALVVAVALLAHLAMLLRARPAVADHAAHEMTATGAAHDGRGKADHSMLVACLVVLSAVAAWGLLSRGRARLRRGATLEARMPARHAETALPGGPTRVDAGVVLRL